MLSSGGTRGEMATGGAVSLSRRFPGVGMKMRWIDGGHVGVPPARGSSFLVERHACGRAGVCAGRALERWSFHGTGGLRFSILGSWFFEIFNGN